uniref:EGF-like domain-containing protein n=2 Tax=Strongyloides stercoralis TaxID=6248 RepID=A0A0K0E9Z4_STRER
MPNVIVLRISLIKIFFYICFFIYLTIHLVDGCISSRTLREIAQKLFSEDEIFINSTKTEIPKKLTQKKFFESIKICPPEYESTVKCYNGGVVKCKFWNNKIVGIPFCHCSRDYGGQYCDKPLNIAYLVMNKQDTIKQPNDIFEIILLLLFFTSILSFFIYLYLMKRCTAKNNFSLCI